ncbi:MAG: thiamine diphosphokinase [Clostridia bacterium]|nr:thiamine diphosphokinase [Clostridia bacterium]
MSVCHIVGAGAYTPIKPDLSPGDLVVVCDGGLRYVEKYSITPDCIIGDFDSLGYVPEGDNVVVLPVKKDVTDVGAAIELAEKKGCREYRLYGCAGGRISHTIANLQNLLPLARSGKTVYLYDEREVVTYLHNASMTFRNSSGTLSLFSVGKAEGVTATGVAYPLSDATLTETFPLGVSNEFLSDQATVKVSSGTLLVTFPIDCPLPKRER